MAMRQYWRSALAGLAAATLAWGAVAGPVGASGSSSPATTDPVVPGQIILRLKSAADLASVAAAYQLGSTPLDQLTSAPLYLMQIADGAAAETRAAALTADGRVAYAETNVIGSAPRDEESSWAAGGGSAADYIGQWAPAAMRLPQAQTVTRGAGSTVAILDTGADLTHPALVGHLVPGYDFVDDDSDVSELGAPLINTAYGHGTFVAGLVALAAPQARLMPVRVLTPNGLTDIWRLAKGMVWAADAGATVINLSLGTITRTHLTNELVSNMSTSRGIVIVAAAGNNANNVPLFPAAEGGARVLAVGATTRLDTLAPFSNFGSWVPVAAPGVSLLSSTPGGGYAAWSGTSMATGLASGEAALVRAAYPRFSAQDTIARIVTTASKISGSVPLRINAGAALGR